MTTLRDQKGRRMGIPQAPKIGSRVAANGVRACREGGSKQRSCEKQPTLTGQGRRLTCKGEREGAEREREQESDEGKEEERTSRAADEALLPQGPQQAGSICRGISLFRAANE